MRDATRLDDLRRALVRPASAAGAFGRRAAVAAIVFQGAADSELLFIVRATHPRDPWSGHVGFPGGRLEAWDLDARSGAIRETNEEIAVDLHQAASVGALDDLAPMRGLQDLVVHPWLFWLDEPPNPTPNAAEVAGVLTAPLGALLAGVGRGTFDLEWKGAQHEMPRVDLPTVEGGSVRLWGMTLRIVDGLLDRLDGRGIGLERPVG